MGWRERLQKRSVVYGAGSAAAVLLVLGILIFVGLLAHRYSYRLDLTRDRSQSLSAISQSLLTEVKEPLTMTAFYPEGSHSERQKARETLQIYQHQNRRISYHFVDPERDPLKAREAGYRYPGQVLLEYQGRRQMADRPEEEALSETLRKLLKPTSKKLYFLTGHGERGREDGQRGGYQVARRALGNEGFEVEDLNLLNQEEVPPEAAAIIVAGPKKSLFANEVEALRTYLEGGGRLLVMLEPFEDGGLKDFLAGYGVGLDDGIVLDYNQVSQALGAGVEMPLVMQYGAHRITRDFTNIVTIFPMARPLILHQEKARGEILLPLASTTKTSWEKLGKTWMKAGKAAYDARTDRKGPFTLAALVEKKLAPKKPETAKEPETSPPPPPPEKKAETDPAATAADKSAYLAVFGSADLAANSYFNLSGNGDLFLNTVNFLAQEEKQITIRRDDKKPQPLTLTGLQAWAVLLFGLVAAPLVMLGAGVAAYLRRRARR